MGIGANIACEANVGNNVACEKIIDTVGIGIKWRIQFGIECSVENFGKLLGTQIQMGSRKTLYGCLYSPAYPFEKLNCMNI